MWFQLYLAPNGVLRIPRELRSIRDAFISRGADALSFAFYNMGNATPCEDFVICTVNFPHLDRDGMRFSEVIGVFAKYWDLPQREITTQYHDIVD